MKVQTTQGVRLDYQAPKAKRIVLSRQQNLLESFSAEADFQDFEDGGEL